MVRPVLLIDKHDKGTVRRYRNEVRMGHTVTFAADGLDFVGSEGNRAIELANGCYDHAGY